MVDQKFLSYIKQKLSEGVAKDTIKIALIKAGWTDAEIEEGFVQAQPVAPLSPSTMLPPITPSQPPVMPAQPKPVFAMPSEPVLPKERPHSTFSPKIIISILAGILVLALIGGGLYFFINKAGLFAISPYTEKNLFSGLLTASSKIHSSAYIASASLQMSARDADAKPFVTQLSNADQIKQQYENDSKRASSLTSIMSKLDSLNYNNKGTYLNSLDSLAVNNSRYPYYNISIVDPKTQQPYGYTLTENGKNYSLTVTFETLAAINQIKRSSKFSDTTTIINGKTVTFTKDSYHYLYLSATPPKPFFVSLADAMVRVPPETKVNFSASAQTDFTNQDSTDWKFNADATGDFGDLTYKFNVDALRKDNIYYARINNMPAFFFSYIGIDKGQWIKVDPSETSSAGGYYSYLSNLPAQEKYFKEHRQEITDALKRIITIADNENLFTFKSAPHQETVNGQKLYKYELLVNKEAIVPFYKKIVEESNKANLKNSYPLLVDDAYLEYLQSPEFSEVFDYYQKNTSLTLWVDPQGFPAIVSYTMRIVPADSVTQLKDKQANLVFKLELSEINKPVTITAPADAKDINDLFPEGKDAAIKGTLSTILTNSAVHYDSTLSFANFCTSAWYTKPAATIVASGGNPICKVNIANTAFCACSSLKSSTTDVYCIDSTGQKKQTTNTCSNACTVNGSCK